MLWRWISGLAGSGAVLALAASGTQDGQAGQGGGQFPAGWNAPDSPRDTAELKSQLFGAIISHDILPRPTNEGADLFGVGADESGEGEDTPRATTFPEVILVADVDGIPTAYLLNVDRTILQAQSGMQIAEWRILDVNFDRILVSNEIDEIAVPIFANDGGDSG